MPIVRFAWNPVLIEVRRECCPRARWDAARRAWTMTQDEAEAFIQASHTRLELGRVSNEIFVDGARWIVGFARGAPLVLPVQA
jgi:hypothetical protein